MTGAENRRYFSVDEANALIPMLEVRFGTVMRLRSQLRAVYQELEERDGAPLPREAALEQLRSSGRFRILMEALAEELQAIESTGVTIKDLDVGLCDFLGERNGREVWLCWQFGEKRVGYWHDLTSGFSDRRPLQEGRTRSDPSLH